MEINGIDEGLNFDGDVDDGFVLPPPLNESLLADDPVNIAGENDVVNIQDNVDGDETQDSAEKKKKKRVCKPRVNLNEQRLCSKKGIEALKNLCSDEVFKGKGHEVSDLNKLLYRFEHWAQCLMPSWPFDNVVQKCEVLGDKAQVKNELKRIRQNEEEILRGEPEDDEALAEAGTGQADETNGEDSVEIPAEQEVQQEEERPPVEITEEQRERIRQNRLLALERREAKRKRLEEESQTQSQLDVDTTNSEGQINEENSSQEPILRIGTSQDLNPDETLEDERRLEDEIHQVFATTDDQIDNMDYINNDADTELNVERCNGKSENIDSAQLLNMNSKYDQDLKNDDSSDEDDEILNRSAFEDASLSVDKNSEINTGTDEQLQNQNNQNNNENKTVLENNEGDSSSLDDEIADINTSTLAKEHEALSEEASTPILENMAEEDRNKINVDSSVTG